MKTEIACVIDRSGSMESIRDDAIGGFNTFLKEQKAIDAPCRFSMCLFDHEYNLLHDGIEIRYIKELDTTTYVPRGYTALLDAIGRTINAIDSRISEYPDDKKPEKIIFVILTDGYENSSREFNKAKIKEMIEDKEKNHNWEVMYLAAHEDAFHEAGMIGIQVNKMASFSNTGAGGQSAFASANSNTTAYRAGVTPTATLQDVVDKEEDKRASS